MDTLAKPSLAKIILWVVVVHLIVLVWLGIAKKQQIPPPKKERLVVQTVTLSPKKVVTPKPKPKPKPVQKKPAPVKKEKPKVNQELLTKAQENIAKIHKSRDKRSVKSEAPAAPKKLDFAEKEEPVLSVEAFDYREELISRLKLLLKLPEYGKVKVQLTLSRAGQVKGVEIVSAESALNRSYVEKTLPQLKFPGFGDNFGHASTHTFAITLENEV